MEEKIIFINQLRVNYKIAGSGPAILIFHGWGSNSDNWQKVGDLLTEKGFRVIIPDLPGFGKSQEPLEIWGINNYSQFAQKLVDFLNLEKFYLLGHSFGGVVALKFSLKSPERIKKLFLVSPAIIRKKTLKQRIIKKIAKFFSFLPFQIKKIIYQKILRSDYPLNPGIMRGIYLKVTGEEISSHLPKIKIPTVIIWGQEDRITPLAQAYLIKKEIPNSILKIIPGVGHGINLEDPYRLTQFILDSLKN